MSSAIILDPTSEEKRYYPHPFPVLDFKFRNTGVGTSFLTSFQVRILKAEMDIAPDLRFDWSLGVPEGEVGYNSSQNKNASSLRIYARNFGWGDAHALRFTSVDELDELFYKPSFEACKSVGVKSELIREYSIADLNLENFKTRAAESKGSASVSLPASFSRHSWGEPSHHAILGEGAPYVVIEKFEFAWECEDERGREYEGDERLTDRQIDNWGGVLFLSEKGFTFLSHGPANAYAVSPGPTTCVMIDPDLGAHVRSYPLSRGVKHGDIERFQILIGASKSCALDLSFNFAVDGLKKPICWKPISLYIANSRYNAYHNRYRDGQVILDEITDKMERQAQAVAGSG